MTFFEIAGTGDEFFEHGANLSGDGVGYERSDWSARGQGCLLLGRVVIATATRFFAGFARPVRGVVAHGGSPVEFPRCDPPGLEGRPRWNRGNLPAMEAIVEIGAEKDTERSRTDRFQGEVDRQIGVFAIFPRGTDKLFG